MSYVVITDSGELYHHGIKGQQWGKQNGPPYPLRESVHDKIVKRAKTESGKTGADVGKVIGQVQSGISIASQTPAAIALVASIAAVNPPLAAVAAASAAGGAFVEYKLNTIADAWIGSKIGDAVEKSKSKRANQ